MQLAAVFIGQNTLATEKDSLTRGADEAICTGSVVIQRNILSRGYWKVIIQFHMHI